MAGSVHTDAYRFLVDQLTEGRRRAGMSQQELADRLGRPQSFVAKLEGCERRLDVVEFIEISTAIGLNPTELVEKIQLKVR